MARLFSASALAVLLCALAPGAGIDRLDAQSASGLLPGDVVRVEIWQEEDLSGEFALDEEGVVVFPLLGPKPVMGVSPDRLRDQLVEDYGKYLVNTAVNVTLLRRIAVLGEVRVPGLYLIDATNSVADVIARAQGVTSDGDAAKIDLVRSGRTVRATLTGVEILQDADIRSGDQIIVGRRGWLSRNFSSVVSVASLIANVAVIILVQ
jgi:polysaccharide export outer membrane protein